jgi:HSF-type DNA-binding
MQLNMYGFHKSRKDPTQLVFSHPNFQQNRQDLLRQVRRKVKKESFQDVERSEQLEKDMEEEYTPKSSPKSQPKIYVTPEENKLIAADK